MQVPPAVRVSKTTRAGVNDPAFWPAAFLLVTGIGVILVSALTSLTVATQAEIWVAVGTLSLAMATYFAVLKSQQMIALEKRRHEQSFAPLVQIRPPDRTVPLTQFILENVGPGIALSVIVMMKGRCSDDSGHFFSSFDGSAIGPNSTRTITNDLLTRKASDYLFTRVDIWYHDIFGNRFITKYRDPGLSSMTRYDWMRHAELLPDLTNADTPFSETG